MNTPPSTQKKINKKKINSPNKKKMKPSAYKTIRQETIFIV